jgi:hypothetical protein
VREYETTVIIQPEISDEAVQDPVDPGEQLLTSLIGDLGLNDESRLVFPQCVSP